MLATHAGVPFLSAWVARLLPKPVGPAAVDVAVVVLAQATCYAGLSWLIGRQLRFLALQTRAAPQTPAPWLLFGARFFHNPASGWLMPFALPAGTAVVLSAPLALLGEIPAILWGLALLYAATLVASALRPDPPLHLVGQANAGAGAECAEDVRVLV